MRSLITACLLLFSTTAASSQSSGMTLHKGDRVFLRVPLSAFHHVPTGFHLWLAEAALQDSVVVVNRNPHWQASGFVYPKSVRVADIKLDSRHQLWRARFERGREPDLTLTVPLTDTTIVIPRLVDANADSAEVMADSYAAIAERLFPGVEDSIPGPTRDQLLGVIDSLLGGDSLRVVMFQGAPYIEIPAPAPDSISVSSSLPPPKQRGMVMNQLVIPMIWHIGRTDPPLPRSLGFSIPFRVQIFHGTPTGAYVAQLLINPGGYLSPGKMTHQDLTFYFTGDQASKFAAAALTRQELVDQSATILKGSYVPVDVSE